MTDACAKAILDAIRRSFEVRPEEGRLIWRDPPKTHPRLLGRDAGRASRSGSGKIYVQIKIAGRTYRRGRLIYLWVHGRLPAPCVDHIDGISTNDSIANLREASIEQNARNHKRRAKRSAHPMGVRRLPSGRFQSRITCSGRLITLGTFDCERRAKSAYDKARSELFGEFA